MANQLQRSSTRTTGPAAVAPSSNAGPLSDREEVVRRFRAEGRVQEFDAGDVLPSAMSPPGGGDEIFLVVSGRLDVTAAFGGNRRMLIAILAAGDIVSARELSCLPCLSVTAVAPSALLVLTVPAGKDCGASAFAAAVGSLSDLRFVRQLVVHTLMLGGLTGAERLASFLLERALASPAASGDSDIVELAGPINRYDMANYLALNPDTLSRLMARFRREGIIVAVSRSLLRVDMRKLRERTPLADAMPPD